MIDLDGDSLARAAGAEVVARGAPGGPSGVSIDSREVSAGDLFVGLRGSRVDGGEHAAAALESGAWGVLVSADRADAPTGGWVLSSGDPLAALQSLARSVRRTLDAPVVGVTGSVGKTSTKDICARLIDAHPSPANRNTEIGLPLAILGAPGDGRGLVLEMAMRGRGQIAELCAIAEPDAAAITNVGPVHLELLGSVEAVAATKAEAISGIRPGGTAVVPADEPLLEPHLDPSVRTLTFGPGGDVQARSVGPGPDGGTAVTVSTPEGEAEMVFPFAELHNVTNALCAIALGLAVRVPLDLMARRAGSVAISPLRGELVDLPGDVVIVNDCYNANPLSMRAAIDHLSRLDAPGRRIAVLGDMAELGPEARDFHARVGEEARKAGIDVIVGVGDLAASYGPDVHAPDAEEGVRLLRDLLGPGDRILVKGSRSVGLEAIAEALASAPGEAEG